MWHHRVESTPDAEALMFRSSPSSWETLSWRQAADRVTRIANALLAHGLDNEQRCVVVAETSAEWILADLGILCAGGATTTIYPTSTSEECTYILNDSEARVVFCGTPALVAQFRRLESGATPPRLILLRGSAEGATSLDAFEAEGAAWQAQHPDAYEARKASISLDHVATLMYTSGTTGVPKGVLLTHDAWVYQGEAIDALGMMNPADRQYLFLPLSHVFAKVMEVSFIRLGIPTVVDSSVDDLVQNLEQTQPTWMAAVPRVFERAFNAIVSEARQAGGVRYATFRWAIRVGTEMSETRQDGASPSRGLRLRWTLADRLVFQPIKQRFGGKMRFFISGGAPLSADIARFLHACDLLILEGYGLTESSAASCVNRVNDYRFGTVGPPLPGCEIRIADDGEILIRGRGVMKGYHNLPEETADAFTEDGWLRTGDIGHILEGGHLRITDRLKDLIVTAGGKNIAPAHFEQRLCGQSPFIAHVVMHGDRRPFCSALIALDFDAVGRWARSQNLSFTDLADLNTKPEILALVQAQVDVVNATLPPFEQVRVFHLIDEALSQEGGSLTATLKVKRAVVTQRHQSVLDGFYEGTLAKI
jgi:long-chain acyl-CoA synthetase